MDMQHKYSKPGQYTLKMSNIVTAPELDHMYSIKNCGSCTSSDGFLIYSEDENILTYVEPEEMSSLFTYVKSDSTVEMKFSNDEDFSENIDYSQKIINDLIIIQPLNPLTIAIPAGLSVNEELHNARLNARYVKFPIQTYSMNIQASAFSNMDWLESVYLPPYISSIGNDAFIGCSNLKYVACPTSLSSELSLAIPTLIQQLCEILLYGKTNSENKLLMLFLRKIAFGATQPSEEETNLSTLDNSNNHICPNPGVEEPKDYDTGGADKELIDNHVLMLSGCNYKNVQNKRELEVAELCSITTQIGYLYTLLSTSYFPKNSINDLDIDVWLLKDNDGKDIPSDIKESIINNSIKKHYISADKLKIDNSYIQDAIRSLTSEIHVKGNYVNWYIDGYLYSERSNVDYFIDTANNWYSSNYTVEKHTTIPLLEPKTITILFSNDGFKTSYKVNTTISEIDVCFTMTLKLLNLGIVDSHTTYTGWGLKTYDRYTHDHYAEEYLYKPYYYLALEETHLDSEDAYDETAGKITIEYPHTVTIDYEKKYNDDSFYTEYENYTIDNDSSIEISLLSAAAPAFKYSYYDWVVLSVDSNCMMHHTGHIEQASSKYGVVKFIKGCLTKEEVDACLDLYYPIPDPDECELTK